MAAHGTTISFMISVIPGGTSRIDSWINGETGRQSDTAIDYDSQSTNWRINVFRYSTLIYQVYTVTLWWNLLMQTLIDPMEICWTQWPHTAAWVAMRCRETCRELVKSLGRAQCGLEQNLLAHVSSMWCNCYKVIINPRWQCTRGL